MPSIRMAATAGWLCNWVAHANFLRWRVRRDDSPMNGTPGTVAGFQADVLLSLVRRMPPSNRRVCDTAAPKSDHARVRIDAERRAQPSDLHGGTE